MALLAFDQELETILFERIASGLIVAFHRSGIRNRGQRTTHRVSMKTLGQAGVAQGTRLVSNVADLGPNIAIGCWKGIARVAGRSVPSMAYQIGRPSLPKPRNHSKQRPKHQYPNAQ